MLPFLLAGLVLSGCAGDESAADTLDAELARKFSVAVSQQPTPAPDFTLKSLEGESVSLFDYRGKLLLLNFSTSW